MVATSSSAATAKSRPHASSRPTINFGILANSLSSMDPIQAFGKPAHEFDFLLYSALVRYDPGNAGKPMQPDLATSIPTFSMVHGKQVWTVNLRHGVICPAGMDTPAYELTSADVVFSLNRAKDPAQSLSSGNYGDYASVKAVNKFTVAITLTEPESASVFLPTIANYLGGFIVCARAAQAEGNTVFGQHPVGTGPFMFKSLNPGLGATFVANDKYFRGKPAAAGWNIIFYSSTTAEEAALLSGTIDAVDAPATSIDAWAQVVEAHHGYKVVYSQLFGDTMWFFNLSNQYLSNLKVRQAIAYAANRLDQIGAVGSAATPAYSVIDAAYPDGISNTHTQAAGLAYTYNLSKAQQLMDQAGYPHGFSLTLDANATAPQPYEILQAQLKKINITINLNLVDATTFQKDIATGNEPIFSNALGFFGSPQQAFQNYFEGGAALNWQHYSGADSLIKAAAKTTNPAQQQALWTKIDDKILADAAVLPVYTSENVYGAVCGFTWGGANPPVKIPSSWDGTYLATVNRNVHSCKARQ